MKLSNIQITKLPTDADKQVLYYDSEAKGLAVRVSPGGQKSFVVRYRDPSTRRRKFKTIGDTASMSVVIARKEARRIQVACDLGDDPFPHPSWTLETAHQWNMENFVRRNSASSQKHAKAVWLNHTPKRLKSTPEPPPMKWSAPMIRKAEDLRWPLRDP
ncbi:Arm DNA-binding domain-containing protein, partial [Shimia thalassica]|uniref:Arm DNA-binding domain-containing protein n=1 Tax=Shimia thalassica TaxID=1715693 RepID=UPI0034E3C317